MPALCLRSAARRSHLRETFVPFTETQSRCLAACAVLEHRVLTSSPGISKFAPPPYFHLVGPGPWCLHRFPSSSRSHASRSSALAVSTTSAAVAFQVVERCFHPSCRPWGSCRAVLDLPLDNFRLSDTLCPSKCSPHLQRLPSSHRLAACTASGFTDGCSPLAVGPLPPPLRCLLDVAIGLRCVALVRFRDLRVLLRW